MELTGNPSPAAATTTSARCASLGSVSGEGPLRDAAKAAGASIAVAASHACNACGDSAACAIVRTASVL